MALTKKDIEHLAELARIEVSDADADSLLKDLEEILRYMNALSEADVEGALPMTGGSRHDNQYRGDEENVRVGPPAEELRQAFPEKDEAYLKVPHVFE